jgi:hypothetical protein
LCFPREWERGLLAEKEESIDEEKGFEPEPEFDLGVTK